MLGAIARALVRWGIVEYTDAPETPIFLDWRDRLWYTRHGR